MNKIIVVGTTGSGKSTLSESLSSKLNIPYIQLDQLFWKPNWQWSTDEEFFENIQKAIEGKDSWIIDGNYHRTQFITWPLADTVIWIDLPFYKILYQNLSRSIRRAIVHEELWPNTGNRESFKRLLSKDSIIKWLVKTYPIMKKRYAEAIQDPNYSHIKFYHLKSRSEVRDFISRIK